MSNRAGLQHQTSLIGVTTELPENRLQTSANPFVPNSLSVKHPPIMFAYNWVFSVAHMSPGAERQPIKRAIKHHWFEQRFLEEGRFELGLKGSFPF